MKAALIFIILCMAPLIVAGQDTTVAYTEVGTAVPAERRSSPSDRVPELSGAEPDVGRWIASRLKYPATALDYGIEGEVVIKYLVHPDGRMTDARVVRGLGYGCDQAVLRTLEDMPRWRPARKQGRTVATWVVTPVRFSLR